MKYWWVAPSRTPFTIFRSEKLCLALSDSLETALIRALLYNASPKPQMKSWGVYIQNIGRYCIFLAGPLSHSNAGYRWLIYAMARLGEFRWKCSRTILSSMSISLGSVAISMRKAWMWPPSASCSITMMKRRLKLRRCVLLEVDFDNIEQQLDILKRSRIMGSFVTCVWSPEFLSKIFWNAQT